jgi:arsenical pump membrane protein
VPGSVTSLGAAAGSLSVLALTLGLIVWRPRGVHEGWVAAGGATLAVAAGLARLSDLRQGVSDTAGVLVFLLAMTLLAALVEDAGVFRWAAGWTMRTARGRGWLLYVNVYLLGAAITLLLSLDVTAVVLTPLVCALTKHLRIDGRPWVFACAFVANTASLALPISNLTNILVYELLGVPFDAFLRALALPNAAALLVNLALFVWLFWHQLPGTIRVQAGHDGHTSPFFRWSLGTLSVTIVLLFVSGLRGWPFWPAALGGALVLASVALAQGWVSPGRVRNGVAWGLAPFVVGMYVVVASVYRAFEPAILRLPEAIGTLRGPLPLITAVVGTAVGSNVVNNLPLALAAIRLLRVVPPALTTASGADLRSTLAFGTLLGVNLGPNLTVFGSLATILCLSSARRQGIDISPRAFLGTGLLVAPPTLLAAGAVLWLLLR